MLYVTRGTEMAQKPANPGNDSFYQRFILLQKEYARVLDQLSIALQSIADQNTQIQILKDEIARLKGTLWWTPKVGQKSIRFKLDPITFSLTSKPLFFSKNT